jgi:hypothetical protein
MPTFVAETYVAAGDRDRFTRTVDVLRAVCRDTSAATCVRHVNSFLTPSDEMGFHVFEAARAADVLRVTAEAGVDVERVVETIAVEAGSE